MKYIKMFKLFEYYNPSNGTISEVDIFNEVDDILLDIIDDGYNVEIYKNQNSSQDVMEEDGELIRIYIEMGNDENPLKYIPTNSIKVCLEHLLSYSNSLSYKSTMEIVDNGQLVSYDEFTLSDKTVSLDLQSPIDYIRFIIHKPE